MAKEYVPFHTIGTYERDDKYYEDIKKKRTERAKAAAGNTRGTTGLNASGMASAATTAVAAPSTPSVTDLYKQQYDLAEKRRKRRLDATVKANDDRAASSLNDAYIQYMIRQRDLPQQLRAVGINGGAAETTVGDINNTYMNNRNAVELQKLKANEQARLDYDNAVDTAYAQYLNNLTNYAIQQEQMAAQLEAARIKSSGSGSSRSGSSKTTTPTTKTTSTLPTTYSPTRYADRNARAAQMVSTRKDTDDAVRRLVRAGYTYNEIRRILGRSYIKGGNGVR